MTWQEAIYSRLSTDTAVTDLIGSADDLPLIMPESDWINPDGIEAVPHILYSLQGKRRENPLSGRSVLANYQIVVSVWAVDSATGEAIAEAVEDRLDGWSDRPNGVDYCSLVTADSQGQPSTSAREKTFSLWLHS